jgi:hypothetical protein
MERLVQSIQEAILRILTAPVPADDASINLRHGVRVVGHRYLTYVRTVRTLDSWVLSGTRKAKPD